VGKFLLIFGIAAAFATTFYERSFPSSVQDATGIVRGKVGMSYSDWGVASDSSKRLYTFVELQLTETLKGEAKGSSIVLRELGGAKDGVAMEVSGVARFERGEDVVVMVGAPNADGSYDVRGMMMAKFNVERGNDGKEYLSGPGLGGATAHGHVYKDAKREGQNDPQSPVKRWTIDDIRDLVRAQTQAGNVASKPVANYGTSQSRRQNPTPSPSTSGQPSWASRDSALPLQSIPAEGERGSRVNLLLGIGIVIGAGFYLLTRFRSRR